MPGPTYGGKNKNKSKSLIGIIKKVQKQQGRGGKVVGFGKNLQRPFRPLRPKNVKKRGY